MKASHATPETKAVVAEITSMWAAGDDTEREPEWTFPMSRGRISLTLPRLPLRDFQQQLGCCVLYWPTEPEQRRRVAIVSSRLGLRKDLQRWWFDALRTVMLRCDASAECVCVVDGTASAAAVSRASELFAIPRLRLKVSEGTVATSEGLASWLDDAGNAITHRTDSSDLESTVLVSPPFAGPLPGDTPQVETTVNRNDAVLVAAGEKVVALSCRSAGNLQTLLTRRLQADRTAGAKTFIVSMSEAPSVPASLWQHSAVNWRLETVNESDKAAQNRGRGPSGEGSFDDAPSGPLAAPQDWLCHWTRPVPGPWPGQRDDDFLDELILGCDSADRSALACLLKMLAEGCIRASATRQHEPATVSWTAVPLTEFRQRRVFRSHRHRYDFEPWGIALRKSTLQNRGAEPVRYLEADQDASSSTFTQHRWDAHGRVDWSVEREWRVSGDIDLHGLSVTDVCVFVNDVSEAAVIRNAGNWSVVVVPNESGA